MTAKQKKILLEAAKKTFTRHLYYSCWAIEDFDDEDGCLKKDYAYFYQMSVFSSWLPEFEDGSEQDMRTMLILLFREVGLEGIQ